MKTRIYAAPTVKGLKDFSKIASSLYMNINPGKCPTCWTCRAFFEIYLKVASRVTVLLRIAKEYTHYDNVHWRRLSWLRSERSWFSLIAHVVRSFSLRREAEARTTLLKWCLDVGIYLPVFIGDFVIWIGSPSIFFVKLLISAYTHYQHTKPPFFSMLPISDGHKTMHLRPVRPIRWWVFNILKIKPGHHLDDKKCADSCDYCTYYVWAYSFI